jgi:peptidoglycan/xylan/chitin deacetylase (PgdA/CDA1 family)
VLKKTIKSALLGLRIPQRAQLIVPRKLVILRYHSVREEPLLLDPYIPIGITHSASTFQAQMEYVAETCKLVSLNEVTNLVLDSRAVPERGVIITFDDGFRDNYEIAAPILERCGLRGVFYVSTSSIEGRPLWFVRLRFWSIRTQKTREQFLEASRRCAILGEEDREQFLAELEEANPVRDTFTMTWAQLRHLLKRGHTIGSHTINHPNLAQIPAADLANELERSKHVLESELDTHVTHFSYPNPILEPHWDKTTIQASQSAGYTTAVTSTPGSVGTGSNVLALPRHYIASSVHDFVWNLELAFCGSNR